MTVLAAGAAIAQAPTPATSRTQPAVPSPSQAWPREVKLPNAVILVYQPQVSQWVDDKIEFRTALGIKPNGAAAESYGTIFATARTRVNKSLRTVVFEDLQITKSTFPSLPDHGAAYLTALQKQFGASVRSIALDRLKISPTLTGNTVAQVDLQNTVPRIIVSNVPTILVPIDGAPVLRPVASNARFQRVINTRALLLKDTVESYFYVHVYDGWLQTPALDLPWTRPFITPPGLDAVARAAMAKRGVDMLIGDPKANPPMMLDSNKPQIVVSTVPAELIVFNGPPDFTPIAGTSLQWVTNSRTDVLRDTASNKIFVLLAGRWFSSPSMIGPWTYVASNALPADFARIPPTSLAGAVLPAVAGTPQARQALVDNSIPQTASIPLATGPKFTAKFDGAPQWKPISGTSLKYAVNSPMPVIATGTGTLYSVKAGVWFTAVQAAGPWTIATSVPAEIYTIPASSPLHYVSYVHVYSATADMVHVGYTPGYLGSAVSASGTVVYGTGYHYEPWIGAAWYPQPTTYGLAAEPVYNPSVGFTYSFALGLASTASTPSGGSGTVYHPSYWGGYPCCGSASANVYLPPPAVAPPPAPLAQSAGGTAAKARIPAPSVSAVAPPVATANVTRSSDQTTSALTAARQSTRPVPNAKVSPPPVLLAQAGSLYDLPSNAWQSSSKGNDSYADANGNVYRKSGDGWQQHTATGWSRATGDTSWADQEAQSRTDGAIQAASYSMSNANRFSDNRGDGWTARDAGDGGYSRTGGADGGISAQVYNYNNAVLNNEFTMWQNGLMYGDNMYYGVGWGARFPLP
ncbi:MAG: autotransporter [Betaproteobacteria bacterium]